MTMSIPHEKIKKSKTSKVLFKDWSLRTRSQTFAALVFKWR